MTTQGRSGTATSSVVGSSTSTGVTVIVGSRHPIATGLGALCEPPTHARSLTRLMSRLAKLSLVTTVLTFLAVTAGGLVGASGSGLGCPGWPKCYGRWIPPANAHSIIEMSHRYLVSLSIYAAVAVLVSILVWHRRERFTFALGLAIVPLFIAQAALGAYVVGRELIWWSVVAHLALAMVLMATLIVLTVHLSAGPPEPHTHRSFERLLTGAVSVVSRLHAAAVTTHLALGAAIFGALVALFAMVRRQPTASLQIADAYAVADPERTEVREKVGAYFALTKPRIIELLLVTTVPTMVVADRGIPSGWLILATLVGGSLAAGGANALNMYIDRDIDRLMERTKGRPLVTGAVSPRSALVFALALEVCAAVELWVLVNPLSAALAVSATAFYVFVYTLWLKRTSTQNIVIGGAAGAVPVLVGWSAVTGSLGLAPLVLFSIIFYWTPPHFWALAIRYRDDYAAAQVPMLPVVDTMKGTARKILIYTLVLWAATLLFYDVGGMGDIYLAAAFVLGGVFTYYAVRLRQRATSAQAMRLFGWSISYVTLLFGAMALDQLVHVR